MQRILVAMCLAGCVAPAPKPVVDAQRAEQAERPATETVEEPMAESTAEETEPHAPPGVPPVEDDIVVLELIEFPANSSELGEKARSILDTVATAMNKHPEFTLLEVAGHARPGVERNALVLSRARSKRIVAELVRRGVAKQRLVAAAYADYCPVKPDVAADALNGGVRFKMLLTDEGPTGVNHGCAAATAAGLPPPEPVGGSFGSADTTAGAPVR